MLGAPKRLVLPMHADTVRIVICCHANIGECSMACAGRPTFGRPTHAVPISVVLTQWELVHVGDMLYTLLWCTPRL